MSIRIMLAAAGLAAGAAFVAYPGGVRLRMHRASGMAFAAEKEEAAEPGHDENDPIAEDKELTARIRHEKAEGRDVSDAVAHQKKGEDALKAGNTREALEHFELGERSLGESEEGEEHKGGGAAH